MFARLPEDIFKLIMSYLYNPKELIYKYDEVGLELYYNRIYQLLKLQFINNKFLVYTKYQLTRSEEYKQLCAYRDIFPYFKYKTYLISDNNKDKFIASKHRGLCWAQNKNGEICKNKATQILSCTFHYNIACSKATTKSTVFTCYKFILTPARFIH